MKKSYFIIEKLTMFKLSLLFVLFSFFISSAQVTTNSGSGLAPTYPDLATAITALNGATITSPVEITLTGNETAPAGGYQITAQGSVANTIKIIGVSSTLTANATPTAGALNDAVIKLIGADFVTIENFTIVENANTTTAAATNNMTEWGIALLYASTSNGCNNITLKGNTIDMNKIYQNSFGIYSNSTHSATAPTTAATAIAGGSNNNLTIIGNTITDVNNGITIIGSTTAPEFNDVLVIGGSLANANTITNYGTTGTFSAYTNLSGSVNGILVRNTKNFNVSYNNISNTGTGHTAGTLRGIFIPSFSVAPTGTFANTIDFNIINIRSNVVAGALSGIINEATTASSTSTISISNNTFNGLNHISATASGALIFIQQAAIHFGNTISNNTFNSLSAITTGSVTFISASYIMPAGGSQTYDSNIITGGFNKTGAGGTVIGFTTSSFSPGGTTHTFTNNNFSGITVTGGTTVNGYTNSDGGPPSPNKIVTGNIFSNWTGGTSTLTGFSSNFGSGGIISNNTFNNITSQGNIVGINFGSSNAGATAIQTITSNTITNLSSTGTGGNVNGISIAAHTIATLNVFGNTINTLSTTGASGQAIGIISSTGAASITNIYNHSIFAITSSGVTAPLVAGIAVIGTTGTMNVYKNKIYNVSSTGATTTNSVANGIAVQGGLIVNTYNNIIGDIKNPLGSGINSVNGIQVGSTVASSLYKFYNNTVYLNASSTGTNFGTSGIIHTANATATTGALDLKNNIIINESVANGTGLTVAFRRTGVALNNYDGTSNKNLFSAGAPSATNVVYNDGTTSSNFATFQTNVAPREAGSFTNEPAFVYATPGSFFTSLTTSNADYLKPVAGITTLVESGASVSTNPAITDDFAGVIRQGNAGYTGTGTSPDLGAFEFEGVTALPACSGAPAAANTTSTSASVCSNTPFDLNLSTSYALTGISYQWQSSPDGIAPYTNITSATSATLTTSQTASTFYQCIVTCTSSGVSTISTPIQVNMNSIYACYCASTYSNGTGATAGDAITNVTLGTLNNSSNAAATPTPSPYYTFYNAVTIPDLTQGSGQTISISFGSDGSQFSGVWIDYNQDGDLSDAGEFVANNTTSAGANGTSNLNFTVPVGAALGNTLMRIRGGNDTVLTNTPCGASSSVWGETEDYIVNITACVAPAITTQPVATVSVCENTAVNLSVVATGTGLTYQWKKDTVNIPSATSATYSIPSALVADSGSYTVLVTGACGSILSSASVVTVTANTSLPAEVVSACDSYTWAANGTTYTTSGTYTNVVNCETRTLNLTITPSSTLPTEVISACDSYTWAANGTTYTTSGMYTSTVNCVTRNLDLTITPSSSLPTEVVSVCDSYTWAANGTTYTTSGIYTNVVNCVTRTLDLTITPSSSLPAEVVSACDSYTWAANGTTYTTSGTYTNVVNCVTRTLNLTINASTTTTTNVTVCDTYTWAENGVTYTTSGTYTNVTTNGAGCPNTATLNLVVTNASIDFANLQFPASATICEGGTMTAYGQVYEAGLTEAAGQAAGIEVQFGYNTTNTNPNTWSTWTPATFNVQVGNNDEYMFTTSNALTGGTYYYTFRYRLTGCSTWQYGGNNNGFWNGTTQNSGVLTINSAATPTGASTQTLNGGVASDVTIEDIVVSGTGIIWYPTLADANAGTNAILAGTVLTDNTTYYAVSVNGTCRSTALAVTVTVVLGNASFDLSQLNYYPNPVKDIFNVKYNKEITSVDVYDLTGRKVIEMKPNTLEVQLNMTNLSSAMYIVKLKSVDGITELKVYKN